MRSGILNDHTDGHIDTLARFVSPQRILINSTQAANKFNAQAMTKNRAILEKKFKEIDFNFELVECPLPEIRSELDGSMLPGSYLNFLIANNCVYVPQYADQKDKEAFDLIQKNFPNKKCIPIASTYILHGGGSIHCMTQQIPKMS